MGSVCESDEGAWAVCVSHMRELHECTYIQLHDGAQQGLLQECQHSTSVISVVRRLHMSCSVHLLILMLCLQVVMAVAQLYHHIAPRNEIGIIVKPLIRLLKSHRCVL